MNLRTKVLASGNRSRDKGAAGADTELKIERRGVNGETTHCISQEKSESVQYVPGFIGGGNDSGACCDKQRFPAEQD